MSTTSAPSPSDAPVPSPDPDAPPTRDAPPARFRLGHRPELDGLRGVAVLLVVLHHTGKMLWPGRADVLAPAGFLGVDLFFALSGFLITVLLVAEAERTGRVRLGPFAIRRVRRLVPALVAGLAAAAVLAAVDDIYHVRAVRNSFASVLTFTHNWVMVDGWYPVTLGHLWSVAIEGQFYLLWGVAVAAAVRLATPARALVAAALAGIAAVVVWRWVRLDAGEGTFALYLSTFGRLDAPLVGALAGLAAVSGAFGRFRGRLAAVVGTIGLLTVVVAAMTIPGLEEGLGRGGFTLVAVAASVAVLGAVRADPDGRWCRALRARWLVWAGVISYSLYVWHFIVFDAMVPNTESWRQPVRAAVGVAASFGLAVLSYRFIERPFLRRPMPKRDQDATSDANGKQRSASEPNAYIS